MRCDHQQITDSGPPGRLRRGPRGRSGLQPRPQPQEIHPAPTPRLLGDQGVPAPRLPWPRRSPGRPRRTDTPARPDDCPSLHHLPEGRRAAPGRGPGPQAVRRRTRSGAARQGPHAAGPPGGHRRHRAGIATRQPLLREAPGQDRKWHAGNDLLQVPEGRAGHRLPDPSDTGGGAGPGPRLGLGAVQGKARPPGGRESGRCWPTPTSTASGSTSTSALTASAPDPAGALACRTSLRPGNGVGR